jgi:hypothetical protein
MECEHMSPKTILALSITAILTGFTPRAQAQVALHTFQPGERARAADVNGNFNNLKVAIEAAERRNTELNNRIRDLEAALANVRALNNVLTVEQVNGVRTVRLSGVNLQLLNGLNRTETLNGAGNLIIGYDEANTIVTTPVCSRASSTTGAFIRDEAACLASGGVFSTQHKSGSHNLVLGSQNNYSSFGGIVAGRSNFINQIYASVLGGVANVANGTFSVIVAGQGQQTPGSTAAILGGNGNQATGRNATVSGGSGNIASGVAANVSGGDRNTASGSGAQVAGGFVNTASGDFASISGGRANTASGRASSLLGGDTRTVAGPNQALP